MARVGLPGHATRPGSDIMKGGCIHTTIRENKFFCMLYQDKVTPQSGRMSKRCEGTAAEKRKCPEWGLIELAEEKERKILSVKKKQDKKDKLN